MRYFLGMILAGGLLLTQANSANAQVTVTFGNPTSTAPAAVGQPGYGYAPGYYGQPGYAAYPGYGAPGRAYGYRNYGRQFAPRYGYRSGYNGVYGNPYQAPYGYYNGTPSYNTGNRTLNRTQMIYGAVQQFSR